MKFVTSIIGNVGRDAEFRTTQNGQSVCSYSVAVNGGKDKTVWVKVTSWGKRAEIDAQYIKKGMTVAVDGILNSDENGNPRVYEKDGVTKSAGFELTAHSVLFLSKVQPQEASTQVNFDEIEEIPF
jgi:single-strand DNA-binding protein